MDWLEQARAAEQLQEWDVAIALVSAHAECFSDDPDVHDNHLWHMDLLARAERIPELTERARTDSHARRDSTDRCASGAWRRRCVTAPKTVTVAPCTSWFG
ncbi:hypothetical protein [Streptomyces sp. NPDC045251]|uniref:hypothetical protein n=1 Tax=unclassified Streptomyces TaxID=2593676 RepID=UPI00340C1574